MAQAGRLAASLLPADALEFLGGLGLLGRLLHRHELAALLVSLRPGGRAAELCLDLRTLLYRALPRVVTNRLVYRHGLRSPFAELMLQEETGSSPERLGQTRLESTVSSVDWWRGVPARETSGDRLQGALPRVHRARLGDHDRASTLGRTLDSEIKFDGYRVQLHIHNDSIKVFTRRGNDWTKRFRKIAEKAYLINATPWGRLLPAEPNSLLRVIPVAMTVWPYGDTNKQMRTPPRTFQDGRRRSTVRGRARGIIFSWCRRARGVALFLGEAGSLGTLSARILCRRH
jgi:ATP dependent DNA ligase domain